MDRYPSRSAFEAEITSISKELAAKISATGKTTVAVVDFTDLEGKPNKLGRFLAEEIAAALVDGKSGLKVINRTYLKTVVAENSLASNSLIDPQTAVKLGKITGAEILLTGTTTDLGDTVRVSAAALDSETALTLGSVRQSIPKTQPIEQLLHGGTAAGGPRSAAQTPQAGKAGSNAAGVLHEVGGFSFVFDRCNRSGANVTCRFLVTSKSDDIVLRTFAGYKDGPHMTRIFDDLGNEYPAKSAKLGISVDPRFTQKNMISGVAIPATFSFEGLASETTSIRVLQVGLAGPDWKGHNFKIRNIPFAN